MTNQELHEQLTAQLKNFYHPAIEADEFLTLLSKRKVGKFSAIFAAESGFKANSNRFLPYMEELVEDQQALPKTNEEGFDVGIAAFLGKLQQMHNVLGQFSEQLKEKKSTPSNIGE
ncbi:hypothetical protein AKG98_3026 [Moritella sp. JT01]|uniref:hypothetical protein n=1 Tax=Moritella sp. JT01 TaxID=756698 RepID=UPI00079CB11A|nr:hypothetical protein [Moritella sp. JT01]KXO13624.1 hypothetical protein AKG98_3026 [Moritella sp. JT01]